MRTSPAADSEVDSLVEFLRNRDVACPLCGYNLRGLTSPRCPECGRELRLSVGLAEPFLRAWITLAVVTLAPAGLGLVFIGMIAREGWDFYPPSRWFEGSIIYFLLSVPMALAVLLMRRRFMRLDKSAQWMIAGLAAFITTAAFATFLVFAR